MSRLAPETADAVARVATALGVAGAVGTCAGALGEVAWALDLAAHFPLHFAALCLLGALGLAPTRPVVALAFAGLALVGPARVARVTRAAPAPSGGVTATVVSVNVHTANRDHAPVQRWLGATAPDVVCVEETDRVWLDALGGLPGLSVAVASPRSDDFGLTLLVGPRVEVVRAAVVPLQPQLLEAHVRVEGTPLAILVVHTVPPTSAVATRRRDDHLRHAATWLAAQPTAGLVCGDLNVTPWSAGWRASFGAHEDVISVRQGQGYLGTWPVHPLLPGTIPIDHLLLRGGGVRAAALGPDVGSDHLPLVATFHLP